MDETKDDIIFLVTINDTIKYYNSTAIGAYGTNNTRNDNDGAATTNNTGSESYTENNNNTDESYLTETQETVLAFLPILSALLSIIGSLIILRLIIRAKFRKPYRRILFGMSCYDILNSITVTLQTFLVPAETSRRLYAIGTTTTCQMLGFLFQFSYPSFCYFGILSIYYVLVVKWNVTDAYFARYIEPILHTITLLWPTITACLGLHLGLYGEVCIGAGCWISEQPTSSDSICHHQQQQSTDGTNETDNLDNSMQECIEHWTWIMGGLPFMIVFAIVLINNLLIYCHVRTTIFRVTRQRRKRQQQQQQQGSSSSTTGLSSSLNNNRFPSSSTSSPQRCASLSPESQEAKVRAVGTQALLYCGVFILTYCWTIILRLASNNGDGPPQEPFLFPIMVLRAIFLPAMGLGTLLVYTRPRYIMLRKLPAHQQRGRWWTIRQVLWDDDDLLLATGNHNHNNNNNAGSGSGSGSSGSRATSNRGTNGGTLSSTFFMLGGGNSLRSLLLRMPSTNNGGSDGFERNTSSSIVGFSALSGRESNDDVLVLSPIDEEEQDNKKEVVKEATITECHHCHTIQPDMDVEKEQASGTLPHPGAGEEEEEVVADVLVVGKTNDREEEEPTIGEVSGVQGAENAIGSEEGEQKVGNLAISDEDLDLVEEQTDLQITEYEVPTKEQ